MTGIVIIGSDSFIASRFIDSISEKDHLKLFARQPSGKDNEIVLKDLFEIRSFELNDYDIVINFTGIVHHPEIKDVDLYKRINTDLPVYLASEAKKAGVRKFVQMSSVAVYGTKEMIDISSEEDPLNIYARTKLDADKRLLELQDDDFKVVSVRPPMVYGHGNAPGNMMKLIKFARLGLPVPYFDKNNLKDFIHISNLVIALHTVIQNEISGIVLPTDKLSFSTYEILKLIKLYSSDHVRLFKTPVFVGNVIRLLFKNAYNKIYGSQTIECNLPEDLYLPILTPCEGIKEMISSIEK